MTYLITGATGDVGARVVRQLVARNIRPRVLVRSAEKAYALFGESAEIRVGDLADTATTRSAMKGVDTLFLVNVGPQIPQRDEAAATVALRSGRGTNWVRLPYEPQAWRSPSYGPRDS